MTDLELVWSLIDKGKNGDNIGVCTGLPKLDKVIGGLQRSRYYLISASSSVGKTALALFMMYYTLKHMDKNAPVYYLYISLEIGADILLAKLMSLYCAEEFGIYLTINDILSFETPLDDYSYECLKEAKKWLSSISEHITIVDEMVNSSKLYKITLDFAEKYGTYEIVNGKKRYVPNNPRQTLIGVTDHLSLINPSEGRKLKEEMDLASSYMVTLKRKLQMSWFVLMQQNRDASSMDRRKADLSEPTLSDIKDSNSPVQDADVVIQLFFPFREKLTTYRGYKILGDDGLKSFHRSLIISKNRYGIANVVLNTVFYGSVGWFISLPEPEQINDYSVYKTEQGNIPCKIKQEKEDNVCTNDTVQTKQTLTFSF